MSIISIHLEENILDSGEKKHRYHRHKVTWYGLVHVALTVFETSMRKIQASMVDLNSVKPRWRIL